MFSLATPRQFLPQPSLRGAGLPSDRAARLAARRAFVDLKLAFTEAVADLPGAEGDWLRHQVRATEEPAALWLLRGAVFEALGALGPVEQRRRRVALRRGLESVFPDSDLPSGFTPF